MFPLVGLAIFAHNALSDGANGFALSYALFLSVITFLWWRTGVHDTDHRPMSQPYSFTFLLATLLFFASVFVAAPLKFFVWITALVTILFLPMVLVLFNRRVDPKHREQSMRLRPSIIERFGLLTIIVIGEVINSIVGGAAGHTVVTWPLALTVLCGVVIVVSLWWVYFDLAARRTPKQETAPRFPVDIPAFAHLPSA